MIEKDKILVSIGIPIFNAEKYLDNAIQSVINQSYPNWELILIDDGSTDESVEIAKSFSDPRIRIVADGENMGLAYRLNQLVSLASGEYYARMDNDDIMHFDRIAVQTRYLIENPDVDVVGSSYYSIDSNNQVLGLLITNPSPSSTKNILRYGCFAHPTIMGRTEWFRSNPYNSNMDRMEDFDLWLRTINHSNFKNTSEPLLFYRLVGIPTLKKYIKSNLGIIKMLVNSAEYNLSIIDRIRYSFIYLLKIVVYCFFMIFGKIDVLIKKRSKSISTQETTNAQKSLLRALSV